MYLCQCDENNPFFVELWSTKRLPFEPKGWMYDMRGVIKSAVMRLQLRGDTIMHAIYSSPCQEACDLENILLYNVGAGCFKNICTNGFLLERSFKEVLAPHQDKINMYGHHHLYKIVHLFQNPTEWQIGSMLATWNDIPVNISTSSKPHSFWYAMKKYKASIFNYARHNDYFGVEIKLKYPVNRTSNNAAVIKPLLDGIISAFHCYDDQDGIAKISGRLSSLIKIDIGKIAGLLSDNSMAVLGKRKLIHPFGKGVQWNPADDKCVLIRMSCVQIPNNTEAYLSGRLFAVLPVEQYMV